MPLDITKVRSDLEAQRADACANIQPHIERSLAALLALDTEDDLRGSLNAVFQARNLVRLLVSGIEVDGERLVQIRNDSLTDVEPLAGVDEALIKGLAAQLYKSGRAGIEEKDSRKMVITVSKRNMQIGAEIVRMCLRDGVEFSMDILSDEVNTLLVNNADDDGLARLAQERFETYEGAGGKIDVRSNPDPNIKYNNGRLKVSNQSEKPLIDRLKSGEMHYSLTIIPTPADAELDGMEYDEYMRLFFEACDQPWEEIRQAQAILKEKLDAINELHITNDDGTDVTLDITGHTFANSVILKNLPGSEVFSSPVREGVNGKIVAEGKFKHGEFPVIEDITLVFEDGRIIDFDARVGRDTLEAIITADDGQGEGVRFLGEIGIGTNPHLRKHLINGLLVEKIGGSFHVALGSSYTYQEYDGEPVSLNNGNVSEAGTHWDLTTLLRGKDGEMYADEELIQKDGEWIDPRLSVLNEGWGAIDEERQPQWWKERYPEGYAAVA